MSTAETHASPWPRDNLALHVCTWCPPKADQSLLSSNLTDATHAGGKATTNHDPMLPLRIARPVNWEEERRSKNRSKLHAALESPFFFSSPEDLRATPLSLSPPRSSFHSTATIPAPWRPVKNTSASPDIHKEISWTDPHGTPWVRPM